MNIRVWESLRGIRFLLWGESRFSCFDGLFLSMFVGLKLI